MQQHLGKIIVIAAVVLCGLAMYLTADLRQDQGFLEKMLREVAAPFSNLIHSVRTASTGFVEGMRSRQELQQENERLRQENAELKRQLAFMERYVRENEFLRGALELPLVEQPATLAAEVIARVPEEWWSQITINRGSRANVQPGNPVIDRYGRVVGKVWSTTWHTAQVVLCVDPKLTVGGRIQRTGGLVLVEGGHPEKPQGLKVKPLDRHMDIEEGDMVLTSGYSRLFPSDLPLCQITSVVLDEYNMPILGFAEPLADLERLDLVYVLAWEVEAEQ